jgi:tetratricopeptide (TPR) repeat protein
MRLVLAFVVLSGPAIAQDIQTCPPVPDHAAEKVRLLYELRFTRDQNEAAMISAALWQIWMDAPDGQAQDLLDRGMEQLRSFAYAASIETLGALVAYCPHFAEGWNQRAYAAFLSGDNESALADLDRALAIDPRHIAALSGKALTLMKLGRDDDAQLVLRDAVRLNPWLGERALLTIPLGTDI